MSPPRQILSLDGGPAAIPFSLTLRAIEAERPGFLAGADLLVGGSDGAFCAAFLASRPPTHTGAQKTADLVEFVKDVFEAAQPGLLDYGGAILGVRSMMSWKGAKAVLRRWFPRGLTLADLNMRTLLLSLVLVPAPRPRIFENRPGSPDLALELEHTLLKCAAYPLLYPTVAGHIDGSFFANNPAMVGVTRTMEEWRRSATHGSPVDMGRVLDDLRVFSLGWDDNRFGLAPSQEAMRRPITDWGYWGWALNPFAPLAVLTTLLDGNDVGVARQCKALLGDHHQRLAISTLTGTGIGLIRMTLGRTRALLSSARRSVDEWVQEPATTRAQLQPNLKDTLAWVDANWTLRP